LLLPVLGHKVLNGYGGIKAHKVNGGPKVYLVKTVLMEKMV
jgi:hypothetical protein